jgi:hypothetical protein
MNILLSVLMIFLIILVVLVIFSILIGISVISSMLTYFNKTTGGKDE